MPEAADGSVEADLLLRWLAECYAAVGFAQQDALVIGVVINRLCQVFGTEHVLPRVAAEVAESAGREILPSGHDILTVRDALEAGLQPVAATGWASFGIVTKQWGDSLVSFLPQLVASQVCSISLRHGPAGPLIYSAAPTFEASIPCIVEVPVDAVELLATACKSLSSLVRALGIPLPERQVIRGDLQVLMIEPERQNAAWSFARLAHDRLCKNPKAIGLHAVASTRTIPISSSLKVLVKSVSRQRRVFDPLSGRH